MEDVADRMMALAAEAVELTDKYFLKRLDYSEASVGVLESLVDDIHDTMPGGKTTATIDLLCEVWGAYLGEVFRRHAGGEWVVWEDQFGRAAAIRWARTQVFPADKVRKRITQGAENNLRAYYATSKALWAGTGKTAEPGAAADGGGTGALPGS